MRPTSSSPRPEASSVARPSPRSAAADSGSAAVPRRRAAADMAIQKVSPARPAARVIAATCSTSQAPPSGRAALATAAASRAASAAGSRSRSLMGLASAGRVRISQGPPAMQARTLRANVPGWGMAELTFRDFAGAIMQNDAGAAARVLEELLGLDAKAAAAAAAHFQAQMAQGPQFMMKAMGLRTDVT